MRILQVVTLLSPDAAFGGPSRVALNQSAELLKEGHDVTLAAATRGYSVPPTELNGVPVRLFAARTVLPGLGFAGMTAPGLAKWFHGSTDRFDVVHIHFARDLVVLPMAAVARRRRVPYVLQTHGMVVPSSNPLARPLDAMWTRKLLRDAKAVLYLTEQEREQLGQVARTQLHLVPVTNGVPMNPTASERSEPPEVLFVARMHPRKRPLLFVDMAKSLLEEELDARFTLVGPDEGEGAALRAAIKDCARISWEGALPPDEIPRRIAAASVYVLPSVREPYPMSVLEAMSVGLPVVISADCGLAPLVRRTDCGLVIDGELPAFVAAVKSILADRSLARAMGERGRQAAQNDCSMRAVGDRLLYIYREPRSYRRTEGQAANGCRGEM
jgi:glycosyltransferase involved in cell wall biosynthesis